MPSKLSGRGPTRVGQAPDTAAHPPSRLTRPGSQAPVSPVPVYGGSHNRRRGPRLLLSHASTCRLPVQRMAPCPLPWQQLPAHVMSHGVGGVGGGPASPQRQRLAAWREVQAGEAGTLKVLWTVEGHGVAWACKPRDGGGRSPRAEGGGVRCGGGGGQGAVGRSGAWRAVGFAVWGGGVGAAADTCLGALEGGGAGGGVAGAIPAELRPELPVKATSDGFLGEGCASGWIRGEGKSCNGQGGHSGAPTTVELGAAQLQE